jgi:hypothetical protein
VVERCGPDWAVFGSGVCQLPTSARVRQGTHRAAVEHAVDLGGCRAARSAASRPGASPTCVATPARCVSSPAESPVISTRSRPSRHLMTEVRIMCASHFSYRSGDQP